MNWFISSTRGAGLSHSCAFDFYVGCVFDVGGQHRVCSLYAHVAKHFRLVCAICCSCVAYSKRLIYCAHMAYVIYHVGGIIGQLIQMLNDIIKAAGSVRHRRLQNVCLIRWQSPCYVLFYKTLPTSSDQAIIFEVDTACLFPVGFLNTLLGQDTINAVWANNWISLVFFFTQGKKEME